MAMNRDTEMALEADKCLQLILDALGVDDLNINSRGLFEGYIRRAALQPQSVDVEALKAEIKDIEHIIQCYTACPKMPIEHKAMKKLKAYRDHLASQGVLNTGWDGKLRRLDDGVEIHKRHWYYPMIEKAHNEGLSARAISRIFPVSHDTAARIVRYLPPPPTGGEHG